MPTYWLLERCSSRARWKQTSYTALSYRWLESDAVSTSAICSGFPLDLQDNVAAALRFHQSDEHARYLWVDTLCIHQDDTADKSMQIGNMLDIYSIASSVTAWLGHENETPRSAFGALRAYTNSTSEFRNALSMNTPGLKLVELLRPDYRVLCMQGKVSNYVAHVSDRTCDLKDIKTFLSNDQLGPAGRFIHLRRRPAPYTTLFAESEAPVVSDHESRYTIERRIAILGCAERGQLASVPSTTRKGDLVVVLSGSLLPIIFSPQGQDRFEQALSTIPDPYEEAQFREMDFHKRRSLMARISN